MFKIVRNKVYLTRGDYTTFQIDLTQSKDPPQTYQLSDKDKVYFIVTRDPVIVDLDDLNTPSNSIFYKVGPVITLDPEDTENLEYGTYYYHVRVVLAVGGGPQTIIEPTDFIITPDRNWW